MLLKCSPLSRSCYLGHVFCQPSKELLGVRRVYKLYNLLDLIPSIVVVQEDGVLVAIGADDRFPLAARPYEGLVLPLVFHDLVYGGLEVLEQRPDGGEILSICLIVLGCLFEGSCGQ